jgi:hypothetical protein
MEREPGGNQPTRTMSRSPSMRAVVGMVGLITAILVGHATSTARSRSSNGQQPTTPARDPSLEGMGPAPAPGLSSPELSGLIDLPSAPPGLDKPVAVTHMDKSRFRIALFAVALLAFVVVAAFASLWQGRNIEDLTRLLEILFAPLVAVVTAVVAFYYRL